MKSKSNTAPKTNNRKSAKKSYTSPKTKNRKTTKTVEKPVRQQTRWHPSEESDDLIFAVCNRFFQQLGTSFDSPSVSIPQLESEAEEKRGAASAVAAWLKEEWGRADLTREKVYPLFWEASKRGFLHLQVPPERQLAKELTQRFGLHNHPGTLSVVNVRGQDAANHVTAKAADLIVDLIEQVAADKAAKLPVGAPKPAVHLGMGAGFAAMQVAKRLSQKVNASKDCPPLVLHAMSSGGFLVNEPHKSPTAYLTYFDQTITTVDYVALFSETVVDADSYEKHLKNPGIRLPFERRDEIDIIVSSLAAADDPHGLLLSYLSHLTDLGYVKPNVLDDMRKEGWVGDVQFRPYSANGPLQKKGLVRAVTLFEIDELVQAAKTNRKKVVLIAGPCGECATPKTAALRPLLENDDLRLWTHLITDAGTARELLRCVKN